MRFKNGGLVKKMNPGQISQIAESWNSSEYMIQLS